MGKYEISGPIFILSFTTFWKYIIKRPIKKEKNVGNKRDTDKRNLILPDIRIIINEPKKRSENTIDKISGTFNKVSFK